MYQNVVVGTLATLNLLVSPLGPGASADAFVYTYGLKANNQIDSHCISHNRDQKSLQKSELELRADSATDNYFGVTLEANVCVNGGASGAGARKFTLTYNLPTELLSEDFLNHLPENSGYVIPGVPSPRDPKQKSRLKVTKLSPTDGLVPIRVEWIPAGSDASAEAMPLTIWLSRDNRPVVSIEGDKPGSLRWRRIQLAYKHPALGRTLDLEGELSQISER